jgi:hypothetical protein
MSPREVRYARNQALFREVNERIAELANRAIDESLQIICECANTGCQDKITIRILDYRRVRKNPDRFIVVPGHTARAAENVVAREGCYEVVEKHLPVGDGLEPGLFPAPATETS